MSMRALFTRLAGAKVSMCNNNSKIFMQELDLPHVFSKDHRGQHI